MGITLILPLLKWFTTKIGFRVLIGLIVVAAALFAVHHFESIGAQRELAKERAATAAEHTRREQVLEQAQQDGAQKAEALHQEAQRNAKLQSEISRLSAVADHRACFDTDSVRRHKDLVRASNGTARSAR